MKSLENKIKDHIRKVYPEWGDLWDTPIFYEWAKVYKDFPFLNAAQVVNLLSYCGSYSEVVKSTKSKRGYFGGMNLMKIPAIGKLTSQKLLNHGRN